MFYLKDKIEKIANFFDQSTEGQEKNIQSVITNILKFSESLAESTETIKKVTQSGKNIETITKNFEEISKKILLISDTLEPSRFKNIIVNFEVLTKSTSMAIKEYEILAIEGRKTLADIGRVFKSVDENPKQFIFGKQPMIKEYIEKRK